MNTLAASASIALVAVYHRSASPAADWPAYNGALLASMGVVSLMLIAAIIAGIILYRRSIAPALPHHALLEELQISSAEESERNHTYEM